MVYTCSYASILKTKNKKLLLDSFAPPPPPPHTQDDHTPDTSQPSTSTPAMNGREGVGVGGGRQLQAVLPGKCFPGGRKFCFACKALTHIHRHTSECSLTGVRKQSKFLYGYSNLPQSQPAGEAKSDRYCSSCVPDKIPPAPHSPTSTHSHKKR